MFWRQRSRVDGKRTSLVKSSITAGEGTVSGSGLWRRRFSEYEEFDKGADEYYNR